MLGLNPVSAVLSIRLTRLKPRGPPKAGAHKTFFFLVLNLNTMDIVNVYICLRIYLLLLSQTVQERGFFLL